MSGSGTRDVANLGIDGLDDILVGGFTRDRLYLVEGVPGSGKTTLAMQFLLAGAAAGEPVLYVTLSETDEELHSDRRIARLEARRRAHPRELIPSEDELEPDEQNTMFHPSEVELARDHEAHPRRRRRDQADALRLRLAVGAASARRQRAALSPADPRAQAVLRRRGMHGPAARRPDGDRSRPAGAEHRPRRRAARAAEPRIRRGAPPAARREVPRRAIPRRLSRLRDPARRHWRSSRGSSPRNTAGRCRRAQKLPSGIRELDSLLGGGIEHGTSTLIVGARGHRQVDARRAVRRRRGTARHARGAVHLRREPADVAHARRARSASISRGIVDAGTVTLQQVDPAELSPGEFVHAIRVAVDDGTRRSSSSTASTAISTRCPRSVSSRSSCTSC